MKRDSPKSTKDRGPSHIQVNLETTCMPQKRCNIGSSHKVKGTVKDNQVPNKEISQPHKAITALSPPQCSIQLASNGQGHTLIRLLTHGTTVGS